MKTAVPFYPVLQDTSQVDYCLVGGNNTHRMNAELAEALE
jgi:hypothetical protein